MQDGGGGKRGGFEGAPLSDIFRSMAAEIAKVLESVDGKRRVVIRKRFDARFEYVEEAYVMIDNEEMEEVWDWRVKFESGIFASCELAESDARKYFRWPMKEEDQNE